MGVQAIGKWQLTCDRCAREETVDYDPLEKEMDNGWEWWCQVGVKSEHYVTSQRLLCPDCSGRLRWFMHGNKTPVGMRFNAGEAQRAYEAVNGYGKAKV